MTVYYNEFDPYAAQWLRHLIAFGHLPSGDVDERDIRDVKPHELERYDQCHFFAGIGGWPLALRLAGWPDDRPVWTGSCPCQPFSAAGKRKGTADERHLWPEFFRLIAECRPATVFGEQVASKDGRQWLAGVRADLEGVAYAVGAADLCSAGIGAPHIRQRLWWVAERHCERAEGDARRVADSDEGQRGSWWGCEAIQGRSEPERASVKLARRGDARGLANVLGAGLERRDQGEVGHERAAAERSGSISGLGHAEGERRHVGEHDQDAAERAEVEAGVRGSSFWSDYDIVPCADGKARRIEPGTFPLAHGIPARVGKLRAYGNAIVPQVAAEFIQSYLEARSLT